MKKISDWKTMALCVAGSLGVVGVAVSSARSSTKARQLLDCKRKEKGTDLTKKEEALTSAQAYIPTMVLTIGTIGCIFGSNWLNKKYQANILSAYLMLDESFKRYRNKLIDMNGLDDDLKIKSEISKDIFDYDVELDGEEICTFHEPFSDSMFMMSRMDAILAEFELNRRLALKGYASLNDLYSCFGLSETEDGEELGWSLEAGAEVYGYAWIDFEHIRSYDQDGNFYYELHMPFEPTEGYAEF